MNEEEVINKKKNVNIKRQNALDNVEGLLSRIKEINEDNSLIHFINEASLFGSILTDKEKLGDIDIFIEFKCRKKESNDLWWDVLDEDKRIIYRKLRNGKKSFSFHSHYELERFLKDLPDFKYKKIYDFDGFVSKKKIEHNFEWEKYAFDEKPKKAILYNEETDQKIIIEIPKSFLVIDILLTEVYNSDNFLDKTEEGDSFDIGCEFLQEQFLELAKPFFKETENLIVEFMKPSEEEKLSGILMVANLSKI